MTDSFRHFRKKLSTIALVLAILTVGTIMSPLSAFADTLYGITFNEEFITIDPTTGDGTLVGPTTGQMAPFGLGTRGSQIFTFDQFADRIKEIDPTTGATINTIDVGLPNLVGEGAVDFRSDGLGFLITNNGVVGSLYSFDITTGTNNLIGTVQASIDGLAFNAAGVLYGIDSNNGNLYTIDTTNGGLTFVGATGIFFQSLGGLSFRSDGTLWGAVGTGNVYTIDPLNGAAVLVGPSGFSQISGLTWLDAQAVPEPAALVLVGIGLAGLGFLSRRKV